VNKGKSKKLPLGTVVNKLLKQSFVIAKSGRPYDDTYVSILPKKIEDRSNKKAQRICFLNL
tara:strand:- start:33634 stop:33816 length:183 start_codon:yes stop_codon:yes gene_type:complete